MKIICEPCYNLKKTECEHLQGMSFKEVQMAAIPFVFVTHNLTAEDERRGLGDPEDLREKKIWRH